MQNCMGDTARKTNMERTDDMLCSQCGYPFNNGQCGNPACPQDKDAPQRALIEAAQRARAQHDTWLAEKYADFRRLYLRRTTMAEPYTSQQIDKDTVWFNAEGEQIAHYPTPRTIEIR